MNRKAQILLVEDGAGDVELVKLALESCGLSHSLRVVGDGVEALAYLEVCREREDTPRPDLILLDVNLPRMNGHEFLERMRADPDSVTIPVVMLTTSASEGDVEGAYRRHVNAYVIKPTTVQELTRSIQSIVTFWFEVARVPRA